MQLKQFLLAGLVSLISLASCSKKSDSIQPEVPIEGNWAGKYSILSQPYNNYYSFKLKAGNVLELQDALQNKTGTGTWRLDGTVLTGKYDLLLPNSGTYSFIASFDKTTGKLQGTWGNGTQEYGGGYWFMNKAN